MGLNGVRSTTQWSARQVLTRGGIACHAAHAAGEGRRDLFMLRNQFDHRPPDDERRCDLTLRGDSAFSCWSPRHEAHTSTEPLVFEVERGETDAAVTDCALGATGGAAPSLCAVAASGAPPAASRRL